jgi:hypothetical protein
VFLLIGRLHIWPNMWYGEIFSSKWQKWCRVIILTAIIGWPDIDMCFWIHLYSMVEIPVTHVITFQKLLWKDTKIVDLEVYETRSIFHVILLLGVGNGRCTQQVFGRLSFFTNSIMPLAILVTVQTCPVTRDKVQSSEVHQKWSISQAFLLSGRVNTAQYMFWGHFFAVNSKNAYKTVIAVKNCQ